MSLLWPQLHEPSFKPGLAELTRLHWRANMIMLRRPRACVGFTAISLVPLAALLAWLAAAGWFDDRITALVRPAFLIPTGIAFLALQHIAFVVAFERSYAPSADITPARHADTYSPPRDRAARSAALRERARSKARRRFPL
jgi:hypothetical protein